MKDVGRFPPIPSRVFSILGPIPVDTAPQEDESTFGRFIMAERRIEVAPGQTPAASWRTLGHEIAHVALWDFAQEHGLTTAQEERVCDAIGSYLAAAIRSGFLQVNHEALEESERE